MNDQDEQNEALQRNALMYNQQNAAALGGLSYRGQQDQFYDYARQQQAAADRQLGNPFLKLENLRYLHPIKPSFWRWMVGL